MRGRPTPRVAVWGALAILGLGTVAVAMAGDGPRPPKLDVRQVLTEAEVATLLPGVRNAACPLPGTLTGGQVPARQLKALKKAGVRAVLDTRLADEPRGYDEAAAMHAAGLRYRNVPIGHDTIPDAVFDEVRAWMKEAGGPVLIHCASGNRVGAVMIPALVLDRGLPPDSAVAVARRIGMRGPGLERAALGYLERQRAATK